MQKSGIFRLRGILMRLFRHLILLLTRPNDGSPNYCATDDDDKNDCNNYDNDETYHEITATNRSLLRGRFRLVISQGGTFEGAQKNVDKK